MRNLQNHLFHFRVRPSASLHRSDPSRYFAVQGMPSFYPFVEIPFEIKSSDEHYHIPLLLSPFAYSTYRGS